MKQQGLIEFALGTSTTRKRSLPSSSAREQVRPWKVNHMKHDSLIDLGMCAFVMWLVLKLYPTTSSIVM